jgi:hypothetical protein
MSKKRGTSPMLVERPSGETLQVEIAIVYEDRSGGLFEVEILGDTQLRGYRFTVPQASLKRVRDSGEPVA